MSVSICFFSTYLSKPSVDAFSYPSIVLSISDARQTSFPCLISICTGRSAPGGRGWPSAWTSTTWCPPSPPPSPDTDTGTITLLPHTQSIHRINSYLSQFKTDLVKVRPPPPVTAPCCALCCVPGRATSLACSRCRGCWRRCGGWGWPAPRPGSGCSPHLTTPGSDTRSLQFCSSSSVHNHNIYLQQGVGVL